LPSRLGLPCWLPPPSRWGHGWLARAAKRRWPLAHRPDAAEHGQRARSRATPGQDRRAERPRPGPWAPYSGCSFAEVRNRVVDSGRLDAATSTPPQPRWRTRTTGRSAGCWPLCGRESRSR